MPVEVDPDVAGLLAGTVADVVRRAVVPAIAPAEADGRLPLAVVDALRSAGLFDLPAEPASLLLSAARQLTRGSPDPRDQPAPGSAAAALLCVAAVAGTACGHGSGAPTAFVDGGGAAPSVTAVYRAAWTLTGSVGAERVGDSDAGTTFVVVAADPGGVERAFAVDPAAVGMTVGPRLPTTGLRAAGRATVTLDATAATLLGDAAAVAAARQVWLLGLGATATGLAGAALDLAAHHLRNRSQFRTPLSRFPALRALVSGLDRDLCAAEAAVTAATTDPTRVVGAARTAAEVAVRITGEAIQLHGGYGYITETGVERLFRDALSLRARVLGAVAPAGDARLDHLLGPP